MVRDLFRLYATGEYSLKRLELLFWEQGWRNHNGNRIAHTTLSGILSNPKYKGYYAGNKVRVLDLFTKKQKFLPPEEWVLYRDETGERVPALVDEEVWEQANAVLKERSLDVKQRQNRCNHPNLLTGTLFCTRCNAAYYRRESRDRKGQINSRWVCSGKIRGGAGSCPSFPIYEAEIKQVLLDVFQNSASDPDALEEEYLKLCRSQESEQALQKKLTEAERAISTIEKKQQKLLTFNALGELSDRDFLAMNRQCVRELEQARAEQERLQEEATSAGNRKGRFDAFRRALQKAREQAADGLIDRSFVEQFIVRIDATPEGPDTVRLQILLRTGSKSEETLDRRAGRPGHMFKKMIESYENGLK